MERSEVEAKYKWKTEDIFSSDEEWEKCFAEAEKLLDFSAFEGNCPMPESLPHSLRVRRRPAKKQRDCTSMRI